MQISYPGGYTWCKSRVLKSRETVLWNMPQPPIFLLFKVDLYEIFWFILVWPTEIIWAPGLSSTIFLCFTLAPIFQFKVFYLRILWIGTVSFRVLTVYILFILVLFVLSVHTYIYVTFNCASKDSGNLLKDLHSFTYSAKAQFHSTFYVNVHTVSFHTSSVYIHSQSLYTYCIWRRR